MHKNLVRFGRAVFELCERTDKQRDKQTYLHTQYNTSHPFRDEVTRNLSSHTTCSPTPAAMPSTMTAAATSRLASIRPWRFF